MLSFAEIERAVASNSRPEITNVIERNCYYALRRIADMFRSGTVSQQSASAEKKALRSDYESDRMTYLMYVAGAKRQRAASTLSKKIETEGCPICRELMRAMDGRK